MSTKTASDIDIQIGQIIRERRETLKVTQAQLASQIGVTFQQVQKYERGVNRVSAATLLNIAEALKCHVADLYGDPDPKALTASERAILKLWAQLEDAQRDAVVAMVRSFAKG